MNPTARPPMNGLQSSTRQSTRAFTLIELLVVIAIMAILAALTLGVYSYATKGASRNRTTAIHRAIISGLESYNSEYGEYPEPSNSGQSEDFNGKPYNTGEARMLYQALSGDGTNAIVIGTGASSSSDGRWTDGEKMLLTEMPREMYTLGGTNRYMLFDGFGHPFQYTKGGTPQAINPTFDLWSYGEDDQNTQATDSSSKRDAGKSAKWIKNF